MREKTVCAPQAPTHIKVLWYPNYLYYGLPITFCTLILGRYSFLFTFLS
jgi:hypothetical protein